MSNKIICKEAKCFDPLLYNKQFTSSAREALRLILEYETQRAPGKGILLPSYVGFSKVEGSGIFDPVLLSGSPYAFYFQDRNLVPDIISIRGQLESGNFHSLLLVHYFGFYVRDTRLIRELCDSFGVHLIEDWAHCIYPAIWANVCPLEGEFAIFSIHKTVRSKGGGILIFNGEYRMSERPTHTISTDDLSDFLAADFFRIMQSQQLNFDLIDRTLKSNSILVPFGSASLNRLHPLNYPLMVAKPTLRHDLYCCLVEAGYYPTALYHTLCSGVDRSRYPDAFFVADRIINLPTHQDCKKKDLEKMISLINDWSGKNESRLK